MNYFPCAQVRDVKITKIMPNLSGSMLNMADFGSQYSAGLSPENFWPAQVGAAHSRPR